MQTAEELIRRVAAASGEQSGHCFWITGLAGAGKTTIGLELLKLRRLERANVVFLDGDLIRFVLGELGEGHERGRRETLAGVYSRLCAALVVQGQDVICCTISLFHSVQEWNRRNIPGYTEVYLRAACDVLKERKPHIYRGERANNIAGISQPVEFPLNPTLTIDNDGVRTPEDIARQILSLHRTVS